MSWGTDFTTNIYLNRQVFNNIYEVENRIEELGKYINSLKESIKMYTAANFRDFIPKDWEEEPIEFLKQKIDTLLDSYEEAFREFIDLNYYLESKPIFEI